MVLAYNPNVGGGLASGAEKLANAFLERKRRQGIASGLEQINSGDWEGGINTISETDPNTALGLVQYKQRADDAMNLEQMKIAAAEKARNSLTPYQREMLALKKQQIENGSGLVNINMNNPLDKKRIETIGKNMDTNIETSQKNLDTYNRMEQLLNSPNVETGGVKGAALDALPDWMLNKETAELRAKIKETVPQMRPKGSGSTSDKDMKIFEQATVGLGKDKEANLNIVRGRKIVDENDIAKEELRYEWLTNGGNLADFDKQWRRYLNENPIFANEDGKLNINRKNAYDWFYNSNSSEEQIPQENQETDPLGLR